MAEKERKKDDLIDNSELRMRLRLLDSLLHFSPHRTHAFNVFSCELYELLSMYRECSPSLFLLKAGVLTKPKLMLSE
jgi:hypothetical protein